MSPGDSTWPDCPLYWERAMNLRPDEVSVVKAAIEFLPHRVIDSHTHSNRAGHVGRIPRSIHSLPMSTFPSYSLDQAWKVRRLLWPGVDVSALRFPHAFGGIDHRLANEYLAAEAEQYGDVCVCYGLPDDISYTLSVLRRRPAALKMYARYFDPPPSAILSFFPWRVLEECCALDIPIIVHLPGSLHDSLPELATILSRLPTLRVVLAHGGLLRAGVRRDRDALRFLGNESSVVVDTALVLDPTVLTTLFDVLGPKRVLYGSDEPLSLISASEYIHPTKGKRWWSSIPYHWLDTTERPSDVRPEPDRLLHVVQIEALMTAIGDMWPGADRRAVVEDVFMRNAMEFFRSIRRTGAR